GLAGGAAGAAAASAAKGAMPMMPMMPMGMGGGGDMGSGRRIPAWLVETENVWGQSAPVAPPVIGEDSV
ncbi:WXG100 family type VII secretion target, partial [Amycolatopsis sp. NPDC003861]